VKKLALGTFLADNYVAAFAAIVHQLIRPLHACGNSIHLDVVRKTFTYGRSFIPELLMPGKFQSRIVLYKHSEQD